MSWFLDYEKSFRKLKQIPKIKELPVRTRRLKIVITML